MNIKRILAVSIVLVTLVLAVVIGRHVIKRSPVSVVETLADNVDVALTDLHYSHNENGERQWTLDADEAKYQRQEGLVSIRRVQLEFYKGASYEKIVLTAGHGTFNQTSNAIELWDHVVVTTDKGDHLTLERLLYQQVERQLTSEGPVAYRSSQLKLTGRGLLLDIKKGTLLVKHAVRATLLPVEG